MRNLREASCTTAYFDGRQKKRALMIGSDPSSCARNLGIAQVGTGWEQAPTAASGSGRVWEQRVCGRVVRGGLVPDRISVLSHVTLRERRGRRSVIGAEREARDAARQTCRARALTELSARRPSKLGGQGAGGQRGGAADAT